MGKESTFCLARSSTIIKAFFSSLIWSVQISLSVSLSGSLMYLNEATLLNNVRVRYSKDKIYVSIKYKPKNYWRSCLSSLRGRPVGSGFQRSLLWYSIAQENTALPPLTGPRPSFFHTTVSFCVSWSTSLFSSFLWWHSGRFCLLFCRMFVQFSLLSFIFYPTVCQS